MNARWLTGAALVVLVLAACSRMPQQPTPGVPAPAASAPSATVGVRSAEHVEVPPPPFSEGIYPCSFCHADLKPNRARRPVPEHEDIVLKHDEENRWCLDCHDANNRDVLHLAGGETIPFEESYRLCGQCHGEKYRDWRAGVHGRRTGQWNGQKGYLLCVHCHSPHLPRFKSATPRPAPIRPTPGK